MKKKLLFAALLAFCVYISPTTYAMIDEVHSDIYLGSESTLRHTAKFNAKTISTVTCAKITVMSNVYMNYKKQGATENEANYSARSVSLTGEREAVNPTKQAYWEIYSNHYEYANSETVETHRGASFDDMIWRP